MNYLKWLDEHQTDMIEDLSTLISIRSEEGKPEADAPFGAGPRDALIAFLNLGKRDGFTVDNVDNYAGDITFGEGEQTVGLLAHVDVVPAGDGWDTDPYTLVQDGEYLQGRGTQDDKGPAIAAYYAMRALKETGLPLRRKVRLILGTNEESNWGGILYYKQKKEMPDLGFTPDAHFPVIFGEKGIITGTLQLHVGTSPSVLSISGGNAPNMVPDYVEATFVEAFLDAKKQELILQSGLELEGSKVIARGKSAHGSTPEAGENAISKLMQVLAKILPADDGLRPAIDFYNRALGFHMHGEGLGIDYADPISGKLNFNVGMISLLEDRLDIVINLRYPLEGVTHDAIVEKILCGADEFSPNFILKSKEHPLYIDPQSPLVQLLMKAYREETGDQESKPITIGGGTYAKAMDNCVGYGAMFSYNEDRMHQKNERIPVKDLMKTAKIYARAIALLATEADVLQRS